MAFTLNTTLRTLSPNTVILTYSGVRSSAYEVKGHTVYPITPTKIFKKSSFTDFFLGPKIAHKEPCPKGTAPFLVKKNYVLDLDVHYESLFTNSSLSFLFMFSLLAEVIDSLLSHVLVYVMVAFQHAQYHIISNYLSNFNASMRYFGSVYSVICSSLHI